MAKTKSSMMGLPMQMLIGLALGIVVGMFVDSSFANTYIKPFGDLFIRLIRMVVVPLVFATLVAGAAGISDVGKLGRVAIKTLVIFLLTSAISVIFGLVIANMIDPGIGIISWNSGAINTAFRIFLSPTCIVITTAMTKCRRLRSTTVRYP